jgi:hypothetical protein
MTSKPHRSHDLPAGVSNIDADPANANWLRQSWSLRGTPKEQADMITRTPFTTQAEAQDLVNSLMRLPLGRYLPADVRAELERRGLVVPPAKYGRP